MSISHTYNKELESLILYTLLPAYIELQKSKGNNYPLKGIPESLLKQIKLKRELPALLKP